MSLIIGIPVIIFAFSYFILLMDYGMNINEHIPRFFEEKGFLEEFVNILTGIIQYGGSVLTIIMMFIWIGSKKNYDWM